MSIHIENIKNINEAEAGAVIHSVPCKMHADCEAQVKNYFTPFITQDDGDVTCNFRGCKLNGLKITLPESYKGIILHESIKPITEKQDRKFYVTKHFDNVTYWNWDKKTSKNDAIQQALDWVDIAEALHSPITEE